MARHTTISASLVRLALGRHALRCRGADCRAWGADCRVGVLTATQGCCGFLSQLALPPHVSLVPTEQRQNEVEKAKLHYKDAARVAPHIHEPHYNFALLAYKAGDIHTAYTEVRATRQCCGLMRWADAMDRCLGSG